jgi:hypothetical protein
VNPLNHSMLNAASLMLAWWAMILTAGLNFAATSLATWYQAVSPSSVGLSNGASYQCLRLLDVFLAEEELPVEVAEVNRIEVDNVDLPEAGKDEVLEQLASDAASADHEHARLFCDG